MAKHLAKGKGGLRMVLESGYKTPFESDEVDWEDDNKVNACPVCSTAFGMFTRKHHCRRCGKVYCDKCTHKKIAMTRYLYADPQRVCKSCLPTTEFENEFMTKQLPILMAGGVFKVTYKGNEIANCHCSLSSDSSLLKFCAGSASGTQIVPSIKVQGLHCVDNSDKLAVGLKSNATGEIVLHSTDKDVAKKWRKATRHVVKFLHPKALKPKASITSVTSVDASP